MGGTSGSRSKGRRDKDKIDLKPVSRKGGAGLGSSSSSGPTPTCPTAFEVMLPEASTLSNGSRLTLKQQDDEWIIASGSQEVLALRKDRSDMLTRCLEKGYRYDGIVRLKSSRRYGEFKRT